MKDFSNPSLNQRKDIESTFGEKTNLRSSQVSNRRVRKRNVSLPKPTFPLEEMNLLFIFDVKLL